MPQNKARGYTWCQEPFLSSKKYPPKPPVPLSAALFLLGLAGAAAVSNETGLQVLILSLVFSVGAAVWAFSGPRPAP